MVINMICCHLLHDNVSKIIVIIIIKKTFTFSETEAVWLSQKFPNFNSENDNSDGIEDQSNDKTDDGNEKNKGKKRGDDGKNMNRNGRSDMGSWTFPYYSCNHQAWLASLVIPIRADNRSLITIIINNTNRNVTHDAICLCDCDIF